MQVIFSCFGERVFQTYKEELEKRIWWYRVLINKEWGSQNLAAQLNRCYSKVVHTVSYRGRFMYRTHRIRWRKCLWGKTKENRYMNHTKWQADRLHIIWQMIICFARYYSMRYQVEARCCWDRENMIQECKNSIAKQFKMNFCIACEGTEQVDRGIITFGPSGY